MTRTKQANHHPSSSHSKNTNPSRSDGTSRKRSRSSSSVAVAAAAAHHTEKNSIEVSSLLPSSSSPSPHLLARVLSDRLRREELRAAMRKETKLATAALHALYQWTRQHRYHDDDQLEEHHYPCQSPGAARDLLSAEADKDKLKDGEDAEDAAVLAMEHLLRHLPLCTAGIPKTSLVVADVLHASVQSQLEAEAECHRYRPSGFVVVSHSPPQEEEEGKPSGTTRGMDCRHHTICMESNPQKEDDSKDDNDNDDDGPDHHHHHHMEQEKSLHEGQGRQKRLVDVRVSLEREDFEDYEEEVEDTEHCFLPITQAPSFPLIPPRAFTTLGGPLSAWARHLVHPSTMMVHHMVLHKYPAPHHHSKNNTVVGSARHHPDHKGKEKDNDRKEEAGKGKEEAGDPCSSPPSSALLVLGPTHPSEPSIPPILLSHRGRSKIPAMASSTSGRRLDTRPGLHRGNEEEEEEGALRDLRVDQSATTTGDSAASVLSVSATSSSPSPSHLRCCPCEKKTEKVTPCLLCDTSPATNHPNIKPPPPTSMALPWVELDADHPWVRPGIPRLPVLSDIPFRASLIPALRTNVSAVASSLSSLSSSRAGGAGSGTNNNNSNNSNSNSGNGSNRIDIKPLLSFATGGATDQPPQATTTPIAAKTTTSMMMSATSLNNVPPATTTAAAANNNNNNSNSNTTNASIGRRLVLFPSLALSQSGGPPLQPQSPLLYSSTRSLQSTAPPPAAAGVISLSSSSAFSAQSPAYLYPSRAAPLYLQGGDLPPILQPTSSISTTKVPEPHKNTTTNDSTTRTRADDACVAAAAAAAAVEGKANKDGQADEPVDPPPHAEQPQPQSDMADSETATAPTAVPSSSDSVECTATTSSLPVCLSTVSSSRTTFLPSASLTSPPSSSSSLISRGTPAPVPRATCGQGASEPTTAGVSRMVLSSSPGFPFALVQNPHEDIRYQVHRRFMPRDMKDRLDLEYTKTAGPPITSLTGSVTPRERQKIEATPNNNNNNNNNNGRLSSSATADGGNLLPREGEGVGLLLHDEGSRGGASSVESGPSTSATWATGRPNTRRRSRGVEEEVSSPTSMNKDAPPQRKKQRPNKEEVDALEETREVEKAELDRIDEILRKRDDLPRIPMPDVEWHYY